MVIYHTGQVECEIMGGNRHFSFGVGHIHSDCDGLYFVLGPAWIAFRWGWRRRGIDQVWIARKIRWARGLGFHWRWEEYRASRTVGGRQA